MKQKAKDQTEAIDKKVGHNLKRFRQEIGVSQREVAYVIGVSVQQIQKYENGINRLSSGKLYKIANMFKIKMSSFFADQTDMT